MTPIKRLTGDRVIVKPVRTPQKYGKIYLPTTTIRNTQVGKVLYVGDEIDASRFKPGSMVIYDHLAGSILDEQQNWLLLVADDIMATLEDFNTEEK